MPVLLTASDSTVLMQLLEYERLLRPQQGLEELAKPLLARAHVYSTPRRQPSLAGSNQEICFPNHFERRGMAVVLCFSAAASMKAHGASPNWAIRPASGDLSEEGAARITGVPLNQASFAPKSESS